MTTLQDSAPVRRVSSYLRQHRPASWRHLLLVTLGYLLGWAVIAVPVAYHAFMTASRTTVLAGHDVEVSPTHDGWATIDLGALLPDVRYPTHRTLGVYIDVGSTNVDSYNTLLHRYAVIASQPDGELAKVSGLLRDMAYSALFQGAVIGLVGPALWLLVGKRRRRELLRTLTPRRAVAVATAGAVVLGLTASTPFHDNRAPESVMGSHHWEPIGQFVPEAKFDGQAAQLQVESGLISSGTQRLIQSAFDSYHKSETFYSYLKTQAPTLASLLHQPADGEKVALLVSDRHDNIGMDTVARAIGDAGGATILFDAGDDTSTGEPWEAFSLDSVAKAFKGYEHAYGVAGNHDNGNFLGDYLSDLGWTMLSGDPIKGVDGIRLLGAPDPRSSGLGSWRTTVGISFSDLEQQLADTACEADASGERVSTMLVHDVQLGTAALERGCVDLVIAGHLHVQGGPTDVTGWNGRVGVAYSNGTTGGAAYAFALGSKLRRDAEVTFVTYRDGRPVGLQPVGIKTTGEFVVSDYIELPHNGDQASASARPGSR